MNNRYKEWQDTALRRGDAALVMDGSARRVLRNTYMLLSLCLGFAAVTAGVSASLQLPGPGILLTLVGFYGLLFLIHKFRNSSTGIAFVFALTGFMGYTLGPILTRYLSMPQGPETVMLALGGTAAIFVALSMYAATTRRDFSFMGGFLTIGILVAFLAGLAGVFLQIPALSLTVAAAFVLLMSGVILFETNNIVRGGETNYVLATVSLFVALFNMFLSLLQLLGFANND